jgi:hypothetical protein
MQKLRSLTIAAAALLCAFAISVGVALAENTHQPTKKGATKAPSAKQSGGFWCPLHEI